MATTSPASSASSGGDAHMAQMEQLQAQQRKEALQTAKMNLEMARTDAEVNFTKKIGESSKSASS